MTQSVLRHPKLLGALSALALIPAAFAGDPSINCPPGTKAAGGRGTPYEASVCFKTLPSGERVHHGPWVLRYDSGQVRAEGQTENGFRTGTWSFYDSNGVKTEQTNFARGDWHGLRREYHPNGRLKLEEKWVMGRRDGAPRHFDPSGELSPAPAAGTLTTR